MIDKQILGELKYEIDSFYVSAEMIRLHKRLEPPLDGMLLEVCLLHFRLLWDFFYEPKRKNDVVVRDFLPRGIPKEQRPKQTARLRAIRKSLDETVAHLSERRITPTFKAGQVNLLDISIMQEHMAQLFTAFVSCLSQDQRDALVNPLARKFANYKTLKA